MRSYNIIEKVFTFEVGCVPIDPGVHLFQDRHHAFPARSETLHQHQLGIDVAQLPTILAIHKSVLA